MTTLFTRRAAEEFADLVERVDGPGDVAASTRHRRDRHSEELATVALLRSGAPVTPRAEFVADLRSQLMAAADTLLAPAEPGLVALPSPARTGGRRTSHRFGTAAAAALVVVGGTAGLAAAAQSSVPGDALYPVKRGLESASGLFNTSDAGRGADLLGEAQTRLAEAQALQQSGASTQTLRDSLADFEKSADKGADLLFTDYQRDGDADSIAAVHRFAASSATSLAALDVNAPAQLRPALDQARATLASIETQARTLCAACGGDQGASSALGAAATFAALITQPVEAASVQDILAAKQSALAAAAEDASQHIPKVAPTLPGSTSGQPNTGGTPTSPGTTVGGSALPGGVLAQAPDSSGTKEALQSVTAPVKSTLKGTTDGVTGLIDEVTGSTPLAPVTKPLTDTLKGTLDGTTGTLDGVLDQGTGLLP